MTDPFKFSDDLQEIIKNIRANNIKYGVSLLHVFRVNYDDFKIIIEEQKKSKEVPKRTGTSIIIDYLLAKGIINSKDELKPNMISAYMSQIKKELQKANTENRSIAIKNGIAKSKEVVPEPVGNKNPVINRNNLTGITELRFPGIFKHKKDWLDPTWSIDEWKKSFKDWEALRMHHNEFPNGFRPNKLEDGTYEWSDFWECVWRHLYNVANEHEISAYDQTYYAGMKKVSMEHGKFWKDLHDARTTLKEKYNLNPVGIGKCK